MTNTVIEKLKETKRELQTQASLILSATEGREPLATEARKMERLGKDIEIVHGRLVEETDKEERRSLDANAQVRLGVRLGPDGLPRASIDGAGDQVYSRTSGNSYFRDMIAAATPGDSNAYEAQQRLNAHAQTIDNAADDLPPEFRAGPTKRAAGWSKEVRVNPNRTDGQGGYFVPPLWVMDEWVAALRAGRATAERCNVQDLPPGTDSINLPKVATGTTTAVQTADAGAVSSTDLTDNFVSGPVRTIAGQNDVALQLVEQSPAGFDQVIFGDLIADYNQKLDVQVLTGTNANGQVKGIYNAGGTAVTYTDASPTVPELYVPLTQAMAQIAKQRFLAPDSIVIAPSLWYWIVAALDTQNRPLVTPNADHGMNSIAVLDATAVQGIAGSIAGIPIVVDPNVPVNLGAGTNQSKILVGRLKDNYLYEGALRTRALMEVLSGTLQVRLQVYNYVAQISDRYPVSYSYIDGTGLIVQTGY
jgi:HK97 family phage major capsid protein